MKEKITPQDNESNQKNENKGTSGTNEQHQKSLDNRSKQLDKNQTEKKK